MSGHLAVGQVWQNGRTAVKVQEENGNVKLVIFDKKGRHLRFRDVCVLKEDGALRYLENLKCVITDNVVGVE
jgi:hypothetical protein